jgi:hypothetical protein
MEKSSTSTAPLPLRATNSSLAQAERTIRRCSSGNATSHADRHGHGCPSVPDAALWRRRPRPPSTVSHELLNNKHKSSSLAGIGGLWIRRGAATSILLTTASDTILLRSRQRCIAADDERPESRGRAPLADECFRDLGPSDRTSPMATIQRLTAIAEVAGPHERFRLRAAAS